MVGDLVGAESSIEQFLELTQLPPCSWTKAKIKLDRGRSELALDLAERASRLDPTNLKYKLIRAVILGNLQRRKEAIDLVDSVINEAPGGSKDASAAPIARSFLMTDGEWISSRRI